MTRRVCRDCPLCIVYKTAGADTFHQQNGQDMVIELSRANSKPKVKANKRKSHVEHDAGHNKRNCKNKKKNVKWLPIA